MKFLIFFLIFIIFIPITSAQEAENNPQEKMDQINQRMKEIEQLLARASLKENDLNLLLEQLKNYQSGDPVPHLLNEFLLDNPEILAKLKNPNGNQEELLKTEDEIRRLFALEAEGPRIFLQENPNILKELLQNSLFEEILRKHIKKENDLKKLFNQVENHMAETEKDIAELIKQAEEMQQQMNQKSPNNQKQLQQDELDLKNFPKLNEQIDPKSKNPKESTGEGIEEKKGISLKDIPQDAWDTILPRTDYSAASSPFAQQKPEGWEAEAEAYFLELAKQAFRERIRRAAGKEENK